MCTIFDDDDLTRDLLNCNARRHVFKIRGTCNSFHFNQRIRNMAYNGVFDDSTISPHDYDAHVEKILHSGDTYKTMHKVIDVLLWLQKNDCDWQSKISGQRKTLIQRVLQDGIITPLARFTQLILAVQLYEVVTNTSCLRASYSYPTSPMQWILLYMTGITKLVWKTSHLLTFW